MYELKIEEVMDFEIAHYHDENISIFSKFNKITIFSKEGEKIIKMPINIIQYVIGRYRLLRRLFRLDKMNIILTDSGYVVFWQYHIYYINKNNLKPKKVIKINCRNLLHNSIAKIDNNVLVFGEYGRPSKNGKAVYRSIDGGITWQKMFIIPCDRIRHIHSCKWDPYEKKIWIFTGDFNGQCYIIKVDIDFRKIEILGNGSQEYRAVDALFEKEYVHWIMDSPLKDVRHIILDRKTHSIESKQLFKGPVWYLKKLGNNIFLACTVQEIGPSHKDEFMHLMYSQDLHSWEELHIFEHDGLKKGIFKFGVASFAEGLEAPTSFFMHFEAVRGLDGKTAKCSLVVK